MERNEEEEKDERKMEGEEGHEIIAESIPPKNKNKTHISNKKRRQTTKRVLHLKPSIRRKKKYNKNKILRKLDICK